MSPDLRCNILRCKGGTGTSLGTVRVGSVHRHYFLPPCFVDVDYLALLSFIDCLHTYTLVTRKDLKEARVEVGQHQRECNVTLLGWSLLQIDLHSIDFYTSLPVFTMQGRRQPRTSIRMKTKYDLHLLHQSLHARQ